MRYHDPYVAQFVHNGHGLRSEPDLTQALAEANCVVVVTDHSVYDWRQLGQMLVVVVDTRHCQLETIDGVAADEFHSNH